MILLPTLPLLSIGSRVGTRLQRQGQLGRTCLQGAWGGCPHPPLPKRLPGPGGTLYHWEGRS